MILDAAAYIAAFLTIVWLILVGLAKFAPTVAEGWFGTVAEDGEPSRLDRMDGIGNCGYQRDGLTCTLASHAGFWHNDERAGTQYHSATFREEPECSHPGLDHDEPWSYCWTCPGCGVCKFIGHGPLCVECWATAGGAA